MPFLLGRVKFAFYFIFWREILTLHLWEGIEPFGRARKGSILNASYDAFSHEEPTLLHVYVANSEDPTSLRCSL